MCAAVLYLPALIEYENYTVSIFYRWWTIYLWVEGVWEMIQNGLLAYLQLYPAPPTSDRKIEGNSVGYWAFWMQVMGMFEMTLSFGTAGIGQVYLERILGLGYLDTQLKLQVHFLMLIATASVFAIGAALFIWNFFRAALRSVAVIDSSASAPDLAPAGHAISAGSG